MTCSTLLRPWHMYSSRLPRIRHKQFQHIVMASLIPSFIASGTGFAFRQDFHQLQIENSQFVKRIEEANQDLHWEPVGSGQLHGCARSLSN